MGERERERIYRQKIKIILDQSSKEEINLESNMEEEAIKFCHE